MVGRMDTEVTCRGFCNGDSRTWLWNSQPLFRDKLMAVPTARVARRLTPLPFSTGLQLAGGVAPKPPFRPSTYIYTEI